MASLFFSCFNVTPILGYGICICIYLSFFRYSIRNTFSLCQAQIFFCIIIFFSMEFKVVFFFQFVELFGKHSGRVCGLMELGWNALGIPQEIHHEASWRAGRGKPTAMWHRPARTGPSSSMCVGHVLPIVLKLREVIFVIFLLIISTVWVVRWMQKMMRGWETPHQSVSVKHGYDSVSEYYMVMRLILIAMHIEGGEI